MTRKVSISIEKSKLAAVLIAAAVIIAAASLVVLKPDFGFMAGSPIKSQEEVTETIVNMSSDIEDVSSILEDIDKSLG
jgi:hypothetical protein